MIPKNMLKIDDTEYYLQILSLPATPPEYYTKSSHKTNFTQMTTVRFALWCIRN